MSRNEETYRLWRVRRTICQMLRDRGYIVEQRDLDANYEAFVERFSKPEGMRQQMPGAAAAMRYETVSREDLGMISNLQSDPSEGIFVFFAEDASLGVDHIRQVHNRMKENSVFRSIIVLRSPPPGSTKRGLLPAAKKAIDNLNHSDPTKPRYIIEVFKESELLVNITEHVLVPQHVPLNEAETRALLDRYKLKLTQLPRIKYTDPIARYYGMQRKQVFKIIRPSETAGRYVTYRLVV